MNLHLICPDCGSWTQSSWNYHYCFKRLQPGEVRKRDDYVMRKWSHTLNCWVLDTQGRPPSHEHYWDAKTGTWVKDITQERSLTGQIADIGAEREKKGKKAEEIPDGAGPRLEKTYEVSSCEVPTKTVSSEPYRPKQIGPSKPWENVDRHKFPNTFMRLIQMYYASDWYKAGPYIPDDDYRDRIYRGVYKPLPKGVSYGSPGYTGYPSYGYSHSNYGPYTNPQSKYYEGDE